MNSGIRMIVSDLDSTYLKNNKTISDYTKQITEECRKQGIIFVVATARPVRAVRNSIPNIDFDGAVYHNGAVVHFADQLIANIGIKPETASKILQSINKDYRGIKLAVEIEEHIYSNFDVSYYWDGISFTLTDFTDLPLKYADKIMIEASHIEELDQYEKYLNEELYIQMSENTLGIVMNKNASKINGIKMIYEKIEIPLSHVVSFGDDHNDVSMLRECGIGVAMGNAIREAKEAADYICDTNDQDGLAKWIEANILL